MTSSALPARTTVLPDKGSGSYTGMDTAWWWAAVLFLVLALYFGVFVKLVHDWYALPDFSHGFLVPIFVGYLVFRERNKLKSAPFCPTWKGLFLLLPGLGLLLLGSLGAELFLARVSFPLVVSGAIWLLWGLPMLTLLRFPILVSLLGIPLPQVVLNQITLPLQLLASNLAAMALPLLHVPVLREGNVIQLPTIQLEVAEACSGIRSLISLFTLSVVYVYFAERSVSHRLLLVAATLPIAVLANAVRIVGTGVLVQFWNQQRALGFFHEFSGLLMFVVSLLLLVGVHTLLQRSSRRWA